MNLRLKRKLILSQQKQIDCVLCKKTNIKFFFKDEQSVIFNQCKTCGLIQRSEESHLNFFEERKRYDLHKNDIQDPNYIKFLSPLVNSIQMFLKNKNLKGLDFGCGTAAPLAHIFSNLGFEMYRYDLHFFNDEKVLKQKYDFILASEVIEHFRNPYEEFSMLSQILNVGGYLGLMTSFWSEEIDFSRWHYRRDPTHLCFYTYDSMVKIAEYFGYEIMDFSGNTCILKKLP